ncbi:hypothetical protein QR680_012602 [Steinernema hermaphroditum]|uniref:Uncharacterized protein n=1 Tax=Steinernema hermaphroditum TaxID=289476 RepID=A0AA39I4J5_9BILA|nr:hypothetical protein QR680_012602 [Steinernema hermaphroditum]
MATVVLGIHYVSERCQPVKREGDPDVPHYDLRVERLLRPLLFLILSLCGLLARHAFESAVLHLRRRHPPSSPMTPSGDLSGATARITDKTRSIVLSPRESTDGHKLHIFFFSAMASLGARCFRLHQTDIQSRRVITFPKRRRLIDLRATFYYLLWAHLSLDSKKSQYKKYRAKSQHE